MTRQPRHRADSDHPAPRARWAFGGALGQPRHRAGDELWKAIYEGAFYTIQENAAGETRTEWKRGEL